MHVPHMQVQANTTSVESLVRWLIEVKGLPPQRADVTGARPDGRWTAFTNQDIKAGEVGPSPFLVDSYLSATILRCAVLGR